MLAEDALDVGLDQLTERQEMVCASGDLANVAVFCEEVVCSGLELGEEELGHAGEGGWRC